MCTIARTIARFIPAIQEKSAEKILLTWLISPCISFRLVSPARHSEILYSRRSISLIGSRPIRTVHNESQHHGIAAPRNPRAGQFILISPFARGTIRAQHKLPPLMMNVRYKRNIMQPCGCVRVPRPGLPSPSRRQVDPDR